MNAIAEMPVAAAAEAIVPAPAATASDKIECLIDGEMTHSIQLHINANHAGEWTIERYKEEYPDAPLLSQFAQNLLEKRNQAAAAASEPEEPVVQTNLQTAAAFDVTQVDMHVLFDFGDAAAAKSASGKPIPVRVFQNHGSEHMSYLVPVSQDYVFNIDLTKKILVALALNKPLLLWGMHGTGKTSAFQQVAARTGRPVMRKQHTANMQESDVLGQWTVKNGATEFQLGPLPMAMLFGWAYLADEYDFAQPSVTAVYQPVLEGEPLLISDAPPHLRKITPHPDFRFIATGNTNGTGDETGLYQGTVMQNAANYSRFGVTEEVKYMDAATEVAIVRAKTRVPEKAAKQIVEFAGKIRESFADSEMSMTISPRELINAADLGFAFGGQWRIGMDLAFINRLPRLDQKVAGDLAQRIFG